MCQVPKRTKVRTEKESRKILLVQKSTLITYSPATLKLNKKYLNFFGVFPQITRVMRSLRMKNNCRNASKNEKLQFFKFWAVFGVFFKNFDFWKILNFDMDQYF